MKKAFLKKLMKNDVEYEIFHDNIHDLHSKKRKSLEEKVQILEQERKTLSDSTRVDKEAENPADIWFKAIRKGKF